MELSQLKYFMTVAELGKISAAAEQLFISPPALSTAISRLEKELGAPLFNRTNNRVMLNEQGELFLKHVRRAFAELDRGREELAQSTRAQAHISIVTVSTIIWTDLIAAFTGEHPEVSISWTSMTPTALAERGLPAQHTFLIAAEDEMPSDYEGKLDSIRLLDSDLMVLLNTAHPLAKKTAVTVDMLADETIFMPVTGGTLWRRIMRLFEQKGLPMPAHNSYAFLARQKMVSKNMGVSFTGNSGRQVMYPNVTVVPVVDPWGPCTNRLYWRKNHPLSEQERLFLDFARAFYADLH